MEEPTWPVYIKVAPLRLSELGPPFKSLMGVDMARKFVEPRDDHPNTDSPFRFLDLPREMRYEVYRVLFTGAFEHFSGRCGPRYKFSAAALMLANRQIYEETKAVLYQEHNFVRLRFDSCEAGWYARTFCLTPSVGSDQNLKVALTIDVKCVQGFHDTEREDFEAGDEDDEDDNMDVGDLEVRGEEDEYDNKGVANSDKLISLEMLEPFVQGLWAITRDHGLGWRALGEGLQSLAVTLDFSESVYGDKDMVQQALLEPLSKMHGFAKIAITGAIKHNQAQLLLEQMGTYPHHDFVRATFDAYTKKAEKAHETEEFLEALQHWKSAVRYVDFVKWLADFSAIDEDDPLVQLLEILDVETCTVRVRMAGTSLRRDDFLSAYLWISENKANSASSTPIVIALTDLAEAFAKFMDLEYDAGALSFRKAVEAVPQTVDDIATFLEFMLEHYEDSVFGHPDSKDLFLQVCRVWGPIFPTW